MLSHTTRRRNICSTKASLLNGKTATPKSATKTTCHKSESTAAARERLYSILISYNYYRFDRLRHVPAYSRLQVERFNRLLDLYLATRTKRKKLEIDPQSLVPKLPRPEELKPFPTQESIQYLGHTDSVRSISVDPSGQWLITGTCKIICFLIVSITTSSSIL